MHGIYRLWLVVLAVLLLLPAELVPQGAVTPEKQADLLFKALGYDRNLKKRAPEGIRIAVVHQDASVAIVAAFNKVGAAKVKGLPVAAMALEFKDVKTLLDKANAGEFNMLYIDVSARGALSSLQQVTRGKKLLSLGGNGELVKQGLAMGV